MKNILVLLIALLFTYQCGETNPNNEEKSISTAQGETENNVNNEYEEQLKYFMQINDTLSSFNSYYPRGEFEITKDYNNRISKLKTDFFNRVVLDTISISIKIPTSGYYFYDPDEEKLYFLTDFFYSYNGHERKSQYNIFKVPLFSYSGLGKYKVHYGEDWYYDKKDNYKHSLRFRNTLYDISIEEAKKIKSKMQQEDYNFNFKFYLTRYSNEYWMVGPRFLALPYEISINDITSGEKIVECVVDKSEVRRLAKEILAASEKDLSQYLQSKLRSYLEELNK